MEHLATARHLPTGNIVDVLAVRDGAWTVRYQWAAPSAEWEVSVRDLDEMWPNTEILDVIDSLTKCEGWPVTRVFEFIMLCTGTVAWAELLLLKWLDLYV